MCHIFLIKVLQLRLHKMKIGFIISMYDEIKQVLSTIDALKRNNCKIIVIQSNPHSEEKILDKNLVDYYELLSDLAGSKEDYEKERELEASGTVTPAKALSRNFRHGFTLAKEIDVDWWVSILGDISIVNLNGIEKIIKKMEIENKLIGVTRAVGQTFLDKNAELSRIQKEDTSDFMPQFFLIKSEIVKKGVFNEIPISNPHTPEQCLGDSVLSYCEENSLKFFDIVYSICDYPYPKFIEGLKYNPDKAKLPRFIDGTINTWRKFKVKVK